MKWIPYIAIWLYGILVTGFGFGSIYNPLNSESVDAGTIPTDIFTIIGIITIYFAVVSTKQNFSIEAREKKRFDLLIISVLNLVILVIPIVFFSIFLGKAVGNMDAYAGELSVLYKFVGVFALVVLAFLYNAKMFVYNK